MFLGGKIATYHSWPPFQWLYNNTFSKFSSTLLPIIDWKVDHYSREMCANSLFQKGNIFPKETVVIMMVMMVLLRSLSLCIPSAIDLQDFRQGSSTSQSLGI